MTTMDFITELFCRIDDALADVAKHPQAVLHPSEVVTMAFLFAIKGVGNRAFYRWLVRDCRPLFPQLPDRTVCFAYSSGIRALRRGFSLNPRFSVSSIPMGSS